MIYIQSKTGGRSDNQDFYGTAQTQYGELIIVCDGIGGHNGGRHAAELAVQIILNTVSTSAETNPAIALKTAIENSNTAIWQEGTSNRELKGMGTTVVALLLTKDKAISCHAGDSRLYQLRAGKILFRTFDHSHVFEMVRAGMITEEQARLSAKSNIITRGLGIQPTVEVEVTDNLSYRKGDRFLLCTDGICGAVPETELIEIVTQKHDIKTITTELVEKIDAIGFSSGGRHDNLTAALIELETNSILQTQQTEVPIEMKKKRKLWLWLILAAIVAVFAVSFFVMKKENYPKPLKGLQDAVYIKEKKNTKTLKMQKAVIKPDTTKTKITKP